jgi:predicted HAD superfamily Cof-like phosphohydrolase
MDNCKLPQYWLEANKESLKFNEVEPEVIEKFAKLILDDKNIFTNVREFQVKFDHVVNFTPVHLTKRKLIERIKFLREELDEFTEACGVSIIVNSDGSWFYAEGDGSQDLPLQADALVDLTYVALGTAVMMGLPWQELWDDVHRANMEKVRGIGTRGNLVDCIKPPGWQGPKTLEILLAAGYDPQHQTNIEEHKDDIEHMQKIDNI